MCAGKSGGKGCIGRGEKGGVFAVQMEVVGRGVLLGAGGGPWQLVVLRYLCRRAIGLEVLHGARGEGGGRQGLEVGVEALKYVSRSEQGAEAYMCLCLPNVYRAREGGWWSGGTRGLWHWSFMQLRWLKKGQ